MGYTPRPASANFASPPPLGNVAPNTITGTTGAFTGALSSFGQIAGILRQDGYQTGNANSIIESAGASLGNAFKLMFYDGTNFYNSTLDTQFYRSAAGKLKVGDATTGFGFLQAKLTTDTAATTGLIAGAFAALTTATMTWYDNTGTAYDVPCKPH